MAGWKSVCVWIYWIEFEFIDKQPNEGRPRPEELIGNAKTQKKNDTHTHKWNSKNRKRVKRWGHIKRVYFWTKADMSV